MFFKPILNVTALLGNISSRTCSADISGVIEIFSSHKKVRAGTRSVYAH